MKSERTLQVYDLYFPKMGKAKSMKAVKDRFGIRNFDEVTILVTSLIGKHPEVDVEDTEKTLSTLRECGVKMSWTIHEPELDVKYWSQMTLKEKLDDFRKENPEAVSWFEGLSSKEKEYAETLGYGIFNVIACAG